MPHWPNLLTFRLISPEFTSSHNSIIYKVYEGAVLRLQKGILKKYVTAKIQKNKLWNKSFCICVTLLCLLHLPGTSTSPMYSSSTCSHNFLAIRHALNNPKRLLSFLWPAWQSFERERDFRSREEKERKPCLFLPRTRARVRPNSFPLPFRRHATQTSFFSW